MFQIKAGCIHPSRCAAAIGLCGISPGTTPALARILAAAFQPSKRAGIEFIEENGGGPGVRLKKSKRKRDNRDTALALM
jgi:hypothetical protein